MVKLRTVHTVNNINFEVNQDDGVLTISDDQGRVVLHYIDNEDAIRLVEVLANDLQKYQRSQPQFKWPKWLAKD